MATKTISLDTLQVAKPCPASWKAMTGDDRVRYCSQCQLQVYNISAMTRGEAQAFLSGREGRLCARFYRRADGTVLTQDCPVGVKAWRRKLAWVGSVAAALLVMFLGLGVVLLGGEGSRRHHGNPREVGAGLFQKIHDWFFPPPPMEMGGIALPIPLVPEIPPDVPIDPPLPPEVPNPQ